MIHTNIGKYKITRLIGEGGMASVYEAEHVLLGTKVAIKVLNPILSANDQIRERFLNEAKVMASLDHPNITKVIDFDEQPQQLSIVMEYLNGEDLNQKIKTKGPLSDKEVIDVFSQTLSAFQYAHSKGIVHRDIKPSNIYLRHDGRIKILDFGIAKLFGEGNELTQTGTQIGTPIYMSPEQVKADKTIDHRSDIYSLGVTLYFAINGKPPYDTNTTSQFDIFSKIVYEPIPELAGSGEFNELIKKACSKDRNARFQTCQEWLNKMNSNEISNAAAGDKTTVDAPGNDKTIVETPGKEKTKAETTSGSNTDNTVVESISPAHKITKKSIKTLLENENPNVKSTTKPSIKTNKALIFSVFGVLVIVLIVKGILFLREPTIQIQPIEATKDVIDIEGYNYKTVKIGDQIWMAENLNTSTFRNGDPIPRAESNEEWTRASENKQPAWCYYPRYSTEEDLTGRDIVYGTLYNWYAVNDPRGLAPDGWHIPTQSEWIKLIKFLGGESISGTKLKSNGGWYKGPNGNNESGFNGLPGGLRHIDGMFDGFGTSGIWWSTTATTNISSYNSHLYYNGLVSRGTGSHGTGMSVRCIRD